MRIGPYAVVFAVGAGGMGEVFPARDTRALGRRRGAPGDCRRELDGGSGSPALVSAHS
jgi:hypothetical protein